MTTSDTTPEVDRPEANHELLPWVIFQIGSDRALAYRFVIARQGADVPLEQDEYVDTTADADGWLGGSVKVLETRASFREWRDIETAPPYKTVLTIHESDLFPVCAFYAPETNGDRFWLRVIEGPEDVIRPKDGDHGELFRPPTHWMPLPDPPQGHKGTE